MGAGAARPRGRRRGASRGAGRRRRVEVVEKTVYRTRRLFCTEFCTEFLYRFRTTSVRQKRGDSQTVSGGTHTTRPAASQRKLSYKETKELEALPQKIEALEAERDELAATLSSSEFYAANDSAQVAATNARLAAVEQGLAEAFERWAELEGLGQ